MAGETEVLGETIPQCHFDHHKSHTTWPGIKPGPPRWEVYRKEINANDQCKAYCRKNHVPIYDLIKTLSGLIRMTKSVVWRYSNTDSQAANGQSRFGCSDVGSGTSRSVSVRSEPNFHPLDYDPNPSETLAEHSH
jgi:hypothetical protein